MFLLPWMLCPEKQILNIILFMEFFSHRADAHVRIAKRYFIAARHYSNAFNKMDLILDAELDLAECAGFAG